MIHQKEGLVEWFEFPLLSQEQGIFEGVFSRKGGFSKEPFTSLNLAFSVGDSQGLVEKNRETVRKMIGGGPLLAVKQVHGAKIVVVKSLPYVPVEADGICTHLKNSPLLIQHADCQAALFYDPVQKVIGNVHAGWKGNVQNIYFTMIQTLSQEYGSKPSDLRVCISPSLGVNHAEFKNYRDEFPPSFWKFNRGDDHFDLWKLAKEQLEEAGVLSEHIQIARMCTYSDPEHWFSYRRAKETGRNGTIIMLK